jgi:glycosyltransferase involved in cell wall biosynthesis
VIAISNGVSEIPKPNRLRSDDGKVRLAFIGGISLHKGYNFIRNAFLSESFVHLRLTIIDHSRPRQYSRQDIWGSTPVEFIGLIAHKEIFGFYHRVDVLLAPSIWRESYGLVTREALASGCWVVASDRGNIGEYVSSDDNGYIIDVSDIDGMVRVLKHIDDDYLKYLDPPGTVPILRTAAEQATTWCDSIGNNCDRRRRRTSH